MASEASELTMKQAALWLTVGPKQECRPVIAFSPDIDARTACAHHSNWSVFLSLGRGRLHDQLVSCRFRFSPKTI